MMDFFIYFCHISSKQTKCSLNLMLTGGGSLVDSFGGFESEFFVRRVVNVQYYTFSAFVKDQLLTLTEIVCFFLVVSCSQEQ